MSGEQTKASDEALFVRYARGDQAAFRQLFAKHSPLVTRIVSRRVYDEAAAHDLVQQTFLQMHRARNDFRPDGKVRPWLVAITLNTVRKHYRTLKRRQEVDLNEASGDREPRVAGYDPVARERAQLLHRALEQLPEAQRRAIELHWLEGLPFPEIAEIEGAKLSAVKVRAHRGYKRLKTILEKVV